MPCVAYCGHICKALYYGFAFLCYDLVLLCSCVMPLSFGYILLTVAAGGINRARKLYFECAIMVL